MATSFSPWGSKAAEVIIPRASAEQHLVEPGECQPGEDSPGAAAEAPPGAVRLSRQAQPVGSHVRAGGKLEVENIGPCRNL